MEIEQQISHIKAVLIGRGVDRNKVHQMTHQLRRDGADSEQVLKALVGALYDGLAYGNWPR